MILVMMLHRSQTSRAAFVLETVRELCQWKDELVSESLTCSSNWDEVKDDVDGGTHVVEESNRIRRRGLWFACKEEFELSMSLVCVDAVQTMNSGGGGRERD
ncbi:hypothetical protein Dimus_017163 [Dionaea muscipula]